MRKISVLLSLAFLLGACSKLQLSQNSNSQNDGIFSNRPQSNLTHFITVIRLQNPPLLAALDDDHGKKKVNAQLVSDIELEQNEMIKKLQAISPEIKVLNKYRLVLNGLAIVAPKEFEKDISQIPNIQIEPPKGFARPVLPKAETSTSNLSDTDGVTSVNFIGADKAHEKGITGKGVKVGIIDTGVDYTHAMMKGPGTAEAYKSVDPSKPTPLFPNDKVVGGIDLVGTKFDSASDVFENRIPVPDANPLDEAGHGSHVAGTIAGIGDNVETYSGVAPDAVVYAIKVFGAEGSTSDDVVIAGLEYAANPKGDLNLDDHLDVVNLSLGSPYGMSHIMYAEAIKNLSNAGTFVVSSAGNDGPSDFITGSPAAVDGAFSVAASIDAMAINWKFLASIFTLPNGQKIRAEAIEGPASKSLKDIAADDGEVVYIGLAKDELSDDVKAQVKGKIALMDRGSNPFSEKIKRAEAAGAIGAIIENNQPGEAFPMGGAGEAAGIPAIMIRQDVGEQIKAAMKTGTVTVSLKTAEKISKPELIDTLTDFSSKGPRSIDAFLKPEISAPGQNIISVEMGTGNKGVSMSGTSMSGPHITGVMALMKQEHPTLSANDLQSLVMETSKTIKDKSGKNYPLSQQGAGRVQIASAIAAQVVTSPADLSLGIVSLEASKTLRQTLTLKNISDSAKTMSLQFVGHKALTMAPMTVTIAPHSEQTLCLKINLNSTALKDTVTEVDGFIMMSGDTAEPLKVAVLALVEKISNIHAETLKVDSTAAADAAGAVTTLTLKNSSNQPGEVLLFNSLGLDGRKPSAHGVQLSRICDLESAGYRIVGTKVQFAVKLYEPITSWQLCDISVLIDTNNDQLPEQELAGTEAQHLEGLATIKDFKSILLDATKARQIRKDYETSLSKPVEKQKKPDYTSAVLDLGKMTVYNNSTLAIIEVEKSLLATRASGELAVKVAVTAQDDNNVESDDFLGSETAWKKIDVSDKAPSYLDLPEVIKMEGNSTQTVDFTKGQGDQNLMVLMPNNSSQLGTLLRDRQLEIVRPTFNKN
jgi:minor extracellular serine protease Vpr